MEGFMQERCDGCDQETECTSFPYWLGIFQKMEKKSTVLTDGLMHHFVWFPRDPIKICAPCQNDFGRAGQGRQAVKEAIARRVMLLAAERVTRREFSDGTKVKCWGAWSGEHYAIGDVIVFSPFQAARHMGYCTGGVGKEFLSGFFQREVAFNEQEAVSLWAKANAESQRHTGTPGTIRLNYRYNLVPETNNKGIVAWYRHDTRARAAPGD
jgi:hypothetical protein